MLLLMHTVTLRDEHIGNDSRYLTATRKDNGDLLLEGQDLGPGTSSVSGDGEYEWVRTIRAKDIPRLLALLDAPADAHIISVLAQHWTGGNSYELERRIRESDIPASP